LHTDNETEKKCLRPTSGLAQAGVWLARKFVGIFNICARANGSETPAFAKPPPREPQAGRQWGGNNETRKWNICDK
jgi:hypothetical protein